MNREKVKLQQPQPIVNQITMLCISVELSKTQYYCFNEKRKKGIERVCYTKRTYSSDIIK